MFHFQIRTIFVGILTACLILSCTTSHAAVLLGSGTGSLMGNGTLDGIQAGDITDPLNRITSQTNAANANWTWISVDSKKAFYGGEAPCGLFENNIGGGNNKFYDGLNQATWVTLQFPEAFVLTHFTLASGNDSMPNNRHPTEWSILGSNDGVNWTPVYTHSVAVEGQPYPAHPANIFPYTADNQVMLFTSFTDVSASGLNARQQAAVTSRLATLGKSLDSADYTTPAAYSWYKLDITKTGGTGTGSAGAQLTEWELFGYATVMPKTNGTDPIFGSATFHMDAGNGITLTDGKVSAWRDTRANGSRVFQQANEVNRPALDKITINGKDFPAIRFNEVYTTSADTDRLTLNTSSETGTVFIINQMANYVGLGGIIGQNGADYGIRLQGGAANPYWQFRGNGGTGGDGNDFGSDGTNATNGYYRYNGALAQGSPGDVHLLTAVTRESGGKRLNTNITLGGYYNDRQYNGSIAEVIGFAGILNAQEVKVVQTYLSTKYGLAMAAGSVYDT